MARIRITIDTEEAHKRAFLSAASIRGLSPQELFEEMVAAHCPEDLERARAALAALPTLAARLPRATPPSR